LFIALIIYLVMHMGKKQQKKKPIRRPSYTGKQVTAMVGSGAETATFGNHLSGEVKQDNDEFLLESTGQ